MAVLLVISSCLLLVVFSCSHSQLFTFILCTLLLLITFLFIEGTPFVAGKFRMKLVIPEDYPNNPPKGYFLTKIYHPNVGPTGDICVNTLKKDWSIDVTLKHILQIIRCLLIVPFPESSLNDEAGKLFMESYDEFARRAKIMTEVHALPISCDSTGDLKKVVTTVDDSALSNAASSLSEELKKVKDAKKKSLKRL